MWSALSLRLRAHFIIQILSISTGAWQYLYVHNALVTRFSRPAVIALDNLGVKRKAFRMPRNVTSTLQVTH